jgi:hypothetical protein
LSTPITVILHEIATDGLPDGDLPGSRMAAIFDGNVVTAWPLDDPDRSWEGDTDVAHGRKMYGITHWLEFQQPVYELERGNAVPGQTRTFIPSKVTTAEESIDANFALGIRLTGVQYDWEQLGALLAQQASPEQATFLNEFAFLMRNLDIESRELQLQYIAEQFRESTDDKTTLIWLLKGLAERLEGLS